HLPAFRRVVVETSGLAEPGPILQLFVESAALHGRFTLDALVALVDAQFGSGAFVDELAPAYRQALLADRLIVTKLDGVSPHQFAALDARLHDINSHAEHHQAHRGQADPEWLSAPAVPRGV